LSRILYINAAVRTSVRIKSALFFSNSFLGFRSSADLKELDLEKMYLGFQKIQGGPVDRCMLYVFRCAVYYASEKDHDPELFNWWNWKDWKLRES
jgi:hypothetical protein